MKVITADAVTIDLGDTETTPTIGITDYSRRTTDDFGMTTIVPRKFSRRLSVRFKVDTSAVDNLQRRLAELRATAATWIVDDRFAWLRAKGFYKDFEVTVPTETVSYCTLTVEGLASDEEVLDFGADPAPAGSASTLQLLDPIDVTGSMLTSSSVAESDAPEWSATATYALGARVMKASAHRVYESAIAGNNGDDPAAASGKWIDAGPTGRWAMFDQALGTVTTGTGQIVVTLVPTETISGLSILDTDGGSIRIQAPGYDRTQLRGGIYGDPGAVLFLDLAVAAGATITVTIGAAGGATTPRTWNDAAAWVDAQTWQDGDTAAGAGPVSVGTLLLGTVRALGITEASPTAGIIDFSKKETDDFGEVTVVERAWTKRMSASALIATDALDIVANRLAAVRARPALWIGHAGLDCLTIYGFPKDWSIEPDVTTAKLSLSVEGLSTALKVEPLKTTTDWPDVGDPDGTKPADNATNSADPDSPFGSGGKTVGQALAELAAASSGAGVDLDPVYDAIDAAKAQAEATAAAALTSATGTLNATIASTDSKAQQARDRADAATTAINDANSDLNTRIQAAQTTGNGATSRVAALETAINSPGGVKSRLSTVETVLNDGTTGLVSRTSTLETSLNAAGTGITSRLNTVEATLTTPGSGLVSRTTTLENDLNQGSTGIKTRIGTVEAALNTPNSGIVSRTSALETSISAPNTGVLARVSALESTAGDTSGALAQRVNNLDAQLNNGSTSVVTRLGTVETAIADPSTGLTKRTSDLQAALSTPGTGISARLGSVEQAYSDPTTGLASRTATLESSISGGGGVLARLSTTENTLSAPGTGIVSRTTALETQMNAGGTGVLARLGTAEQAIIANNTALSQRATTLEASASASGAYVNANPRFSAWKDGQPLPDGWSVWGDYGNFAATRMARSTAEGGYVVLMGTPGGSHGIVCSGVNFPGGHYVIEAQARLQTGQWDGAGVTLSGIQEFSINFATAPDANGTISSMLGQARAWSKLIQLPSGSYNVHAMWEWLGFAQGAVAKTIDFWFCGVRPATDAEIKGNSAYSTVNSTAPGSILARISATETAVTDGRFASASRAATLEAQLAGTSGSNLLSRIQASETAYTDGRFASATRATNLEAQMAGTAGSNLLTRVQNSETAYTDGRFAAASSLSALNVQVNGPGGLAQATSTVGQQVTVLNGKLAAYVTLAADNGTGRAQVSLSSDAYGAHVDIVGDVTFKGKLAVGSTVSGARTEVTDQFLRIFDTNNYERIFIGLR